MDSLNTNIQCPIPWKDKYAMLVYSIHLVNIDYNNLTSIKNKDAISLYNVLFNDLMDERIRNGLNHSYARKNIISDKIKGTINTNYTLNHSILGNNKVAIINNRHTNDTIENRIIKRGYIKLKELNDVYKAPVYINLNNYDLYFTDVAYITDDDILNVNEYELRKEYLSLIKLCKIIIEYYSYNDKSTYDYTYNQITFDDSMSWQIFENFVREILKQNFGSKCNIHRGELAGQTYNTVFNRSELDICMEFTINNKSYICIIDTKCYSRIFNANNKISANNRYQMVGYSVDIQNKIFKQSDIKPKTLGIIMYARTSEEIPKEENIRYSHYYDVHDITIRLDIQALDIGFENIKKSIVESVRGYIKEYLGVEL